MKNRIVVLLSVVLLLGAIVPFAGSSTAIAAQRPADCLGLQSYIDDYHQVGTNYMAGLEGLDMSNLENWTPAEFAQGLAALDTAIANLNALIPPAVASPLQTKATESLQLIREMVAAIESSSVMAALPYIDRVNAATDELDAIAIPLEEQCQVAILDNDNDGVPEIGPGTVTAATPEIDPSATLGSYANPYPLGSAVTTVDGWSIQIDSVTPNGDQQVLAENSFNDAPEAGRHFFIATITATWTGTGAESFDGNYRLRVLGANDETYTAFGDPCGVVPNEWNEDRIVRSGDSITGNLCWSVPTDELPYLRMFDHESTNTGATVYWSLGQEPAQS